MTQLDLRDLNSLTMLQAALGEFSAETQKTLQMAEDEIQRTLEWVDGCVHHWERQMDLARRDLARADDAWRRCQSSNRPGEDRLPECGEQARALNQAQTRIRLYKENLQTAQRWRTRLEQAIQEYQRESRKLHALAVAHTDKARTYVNNSAKKYEMVWQAARMVSEGASLSTDGIGVGVAMMSKGIKLLIGRATHAIGKAGEGIALQLISDKFGLKIVPFDQSQYGFDGILQGPNGQYLLLESKTSEDDKLHLSEDNYGHRQASAGWVAHVAQLMCTPGSGLYSETNAQIGQAILQIGAQQVPILGVVTNPQTNRVTIYLRKGSEAKTKDWLLLSDDDTALILLE